MLVPFLKEHVLGRARQKLPEPTEPSDLKDLIFAQEPMYECDCDICDPGYHKSLCNCIVPHSHIKLEKAPRLNRYGKACYLPLKIPKAHLMKCESLHLARQTMAYFDKDVTELNDMQLAALDQINQWIKGRMNEILGAPGQKSTDFDKLVPGVEMRQLLSWIMELFFGRDSSRLQFHWVDSFKCDAVAGVACRAGPYQHVIKIRNSRTRSGAAEYGNYVHELLCILLHEAAHVHFQLRACENCTSHKVNSMGEGHGRAWQLLAGKVESCFLRFTGLPVSLLRFRSIVANWTGFAPLPSPHDWKEWDLEREILISFYEGDLKLVYGNWIESQAFESQEFDLLAVAKKWWADGPWLETITVDGVEYYRAMVHKKTGAVVVGEGLEKDQDIQIATLRKYPADKTKVEDKN